MDDKIYTIILDSGITIENLSVNGNCYCSQNELAPELFGKRILELTISDGMTDTIMKNVKLKQVTLPGYDGYWFVLVPIPGEELKYNQLRSDLEYLSMMLDVEI